jgi:putative hydrolase of the HAD superfamily
MTLKAVGFDLWETLITDTPDLSRAQERLRLERLAKILGQTPDAIERAYRDLWHRCHELYWSRDRDIPCRTQIDHFLEELAVDPFDEPAMQELEHAYALAAVEILPSVIPGALDVVRELKHRGYALGLISNTGRTPGYALRTILERLGFAEFFDALVFSNEHGECKPQRSIFEALRQSLDVGFDEMLFVGDNLYVDVHGAQQCGIAAVHFVPQQRGTAVSPPVDHDHVVEPVATIRDLRDVLNVIAVTSVRNIK